MSLHRLPKQHFRVYQMLDKSTHLVRGHKYYKSLDRSPNKYLRVHQILYKRGMFLRDCASSTSSWTPRSASCLQCRSSGMRERYPRMEYRLILPNSRDFQSSIGLKRLDRCSIFLALSTGLEAPFQTMSVTWHHYKNSWNAVKLSRISSVHVVTLMADHDTAFSRVKELVAHAVRLAHPKEDYELCLFRDASDFLLGNHLISGSKEPAEGQLAWSGARAFGNATQRRWSIIEKKAFPIMELLDKLRHFLLSDNHFRLFTDHRNLIFLFDPTFKKSDFKKQTVDKLCRWASKLWGFHYLTEHLPRKSLGRHSRWINKPFEARTMALRASIAPLLEKDFSWPSIIEIQQCQEQSSPGSLEMTSSDRVLIFMDQVWVPDAKMTFRDS